MTRAIAAIVLALSLGGTAAARDLELLEGAYEVALGNVALPSSTAGTAVFRPCEDCETVGLRVSSATRYLIGGGELALPDFLAAIEELRQAASGNAATPVSVYYDLKTGQVTRIAVSASRS